MIYRELLCPPRGICLDGDQEVLFFLRQSARLRKYYVGDDGGDEDDDKVDNEEDENKGYDDEDNAKWVRLVSVISDSITTNDIQNAILYVNRDISHEASMIFYGSNRFTFEILPKDIIRCLKSLPPALRRQIKNLGFARPSVGADDPDPMEPWPLLQKFINRRMQLKTVTIQIPYDSTIEIDQGKEMRTQIHVLRYWWPAVEELTQMLLRREVEQLRLAYGATLLHIEDEFDGVP